MEKDDNKCIGHLQAFVPMDLDDGGGGGGGCGDGGV